MSWRLLKIGLAPRYPEPRMFRAPERLDSGYDVVIIGAGGHGLATAYCLARNHGIRRIAVLEKAYIGSGNTGRNTTIIRSNYLTPEGVRFYDRSLALWRGLNDDLGLNLFYSTRGHYTLAHNDATLRTARWRAEVNKHLGVDSRVVGPEEIARARPAGRGNPPADGSAGPAGGVGAHPRRVHHARQHRHRLRHQRRRGVYAAHPEDGGTHQPHLRPSAPGHGVRAPQALAGSHHRLGLTACVRLADGPR